MRCFVGCYTTKRTFYMRTYLRGHKSSTPSVLKLITSFSFAKLLTWMNVTLLSGLGIKIVIDYFHLSPVYMFMYVSMYTCTYCMYCNHLRLSVWLNKETWWWWFVIVIMIVLICSLCCHGRTIASFPCSFDKCRVSATWPQTLKLFSTQANQLGLWLWF